MAIYQDDDGNLFTTDRPGPVISPSITLGDWGRWQPTRLIHPRHLAPMVRASLLTLLASLALGSLSLLFLLRGDRPTSGVLGALAYLVITIAPTIIRNRHSEPLLPATPLHPLRPQPRAPLVLDIANKLGSAIFITIMAVNLLRGSPESLWSLGFGLLAAVISLILAGQVALSLYGLRRAGHGCCPPQSWSSNLR
ncbi:hypothetical protein [Niveispirillum sp. KHB5.9]|uniref:hypothetical protein n=1 Tax=Niveispirillum sp. KHB5.9 TaxID=3400269 RepID=UPI003A84CC94